MGLAAVTKHYPTKHDPLFCNVLELRYYVSVSKAPVRTVLVFYFILKSLLINQIPSKH